MCTYVCRYRWWLYQILAYCLHFPLYTSFEGSVWIQEVVNSHISSSYGRDRMPASILVCVCVLGTIHIRVCACMSCACILWQKDSCHFRTLVLFAYCCSILTQTLSLASSYFHIVDNVQDSNKKTKILNTRLRLSNRSC